MNADTHAPIVPDPIVYPGPAPLRDGDVVLVLQATHRRALAHLPAVRVCACFAGTCRCEVVNGRTRTGEHCKAHMQDGLK